MRSRFVIARTSVAALVACSSSSHSPAPTEGVSNGGSGSDSHSTVTSSTATSVAGASGTGSGGWSPSPGGSSASSTSGGGADVESTSGASNASTLDAGGSSSGSHSSGSASTSGSSASGNRSSPGAAPCDIYAAGNTPCIAAHSTVRSLYALYDGMLYQVRNAAGATLNISPTTAGGAADSSSQDSFCAGTTCSITIIYDQSGKGNHLTYQGAGSTVGGEDSPASATSESLTVSGNKVYSLYINPGNSYWRNGSNSGVPTGSEPEGVYMVTSGTHSNGGCCFDYGNSETDRKADATNQNDPSMTSPRRQGGSKAEGLV